MGPLKIRSGWKNEAGLLAEGRPEGKLGAGGWRHWRLGSRHQAWEGVRGARGAAIAFVLEHWRFFLGFLVFGLIAWGCLRLVNGAVAAKRAKEDAAQSQALDAEMAKIRAELQNRPPS